jgi:hypothetical protein
MLLTGLYGRKIHGKNPRKKQFLLSNPRGLVTPVKTENNISRSHLAIISKALYV